MIISKLEDLNTAIKITYKNSDQTQSYPLSFEQSGFLTKSVKIEGGVNLQYFTALKQYQILGITIIRSGKKVEFTKTEKMSIIKGFSNQGDLYDFLAKILKTYTGIK